MAERSKDELIEAQKEVIGILFEIIKRLQANNDLDEEYFRLVANMKKKEINQKRLDEILHERKENVDIVNRLLKKLEI
ncbi:MAG TPA: hydrolase [Nitrosopumilaceae archaeon]